MQKLLREDSGMNKKELTEWLTPLSDSYEIKIFNGDKEVSFNPLLDIDLDNENNILVIDGRRKEK